MNNEYSENRLKNGSAADALNNWSSVRVTVSNTGYDDNKCFKVSPNGYLKQNIIPSTQPEKILVEGKYLPQLITDKSIVMEKIVVKLKYADGTYNIITIPCVGGDNYGI